VAQQRIEPTKPGVDMFRFRAGILVSVAAVLTWLAMAAL